jgi:Na+-translocating ferredoxin:NAD+ oxidoreductase RnfG subunit
VNPFNRHTGCVLIPALVAAVPGGSLRAAEYLSIPQAQAVLFPAGTRFEKTPVTLTGEQLKQIKDRSGSRQREKSPAVWKAVKGGEHLGWFVVDNVIGKHEFITYGAALSASGTVLGLEILTYRETHGEEVSDKQWRAKFRGKTLSSPFKLDEDIPNISGATLSCRSLTDGVKRLLVLQQVALKP